jgi:hypothetical protein
MERRRDVVLRGVVDQVQPPLTAAGFGITDRGSHPEVHWVEYRAPDSANQPTELPHNKPNRGRDRCRTTELTEGAARMAVRQQSKHELAAALRGRYVQAARKEKGQILDEFVAATGYHRKWALGLLRQGPPEARHGRGGRLRVYSAVVVGALRQVWEASGELCGKRLAPFLDELVPALEAEDALVLDAAVRESLLQMSAATIDRRLRPFRLQQRRGLGTTKPGTLLKQQVPVPDLYAVGRAAAGVCGNRSGSPLRHDDGGTLGEHPYRDRCRDRLD